jgi:PPOX class probable F420-dependent enzyme
VASLDDARALIALDHGLASVAIPRPSGPPQMTVVYAGVVPHPRDERDVVAFVARGGTRKLTLLRGDQRATVTWRAGWAWVTVEGTVELCGPDDPVDGVDEERLRWLLREVFAAAGGGHEDWAEYDRVVQAERRTVVLITPHRIYQNP